MPFDSASVAGLDVCVTLFLMRMEDGVMLLLMRIKDGVMLLMMRMDGGWMDKNMPFDSDAVAVGLRMA